MTAPGPAELRDGRPIDLSRVAVSPEAHTLVSAVVAMTLPESGRAAGPGKLRTLAKETAAILGGLLRAHASRHVASAPRGKAAAWQQPVGQYAFWRRVDALLIAGLIGEVRGIQGPKLFSKHTGRPSRLWATDKLLALAAENGVTLDALARHWRLEDSRKPAKAIADAALVVGLGNVCEASAGLLGRSRASLVEQVRQLNARVASVAITGCPAPAFVQRFGGIHAGGRLYAVGSETFQTMPRADRASIRIDGEAVAEVDASCSQLAIFLALSGRQILPEDCYTIAGVPRETVKAAVTSTLGAGRWLRRWPNNTSATVRQTRLATVQAALLTAYPELDALTAILPQHIRANPPPKGLQWAAGQFLVAVESEILCAALDCLHAAGVVALPIFDGLIVKVSDTGTAQRALAAAYRERLGLAVRVAVKA